MKTIGHHIVMQLCDGRVLATTDSTRRQLARSVLELSRDPELLAFALPDNHLNAIVPRDEGASKELARRIEISLSQIFCMGSGLTRWPTACFTLDGGYDLVRIEK